MNRQAFLGIFVFLSVSIVLCAFSHPASASGVTREIVPELFYGGKSAHRE